MAAGNWIMYDSAKEYLGDGTLDLDTQTFNVSLHANAYVPDRATDSLYADATNELATGGGYTNGGQALTSVTWGQTSGVATLDAADPAWTASGADIGPFRIAVIREVASGTLLAYCVLDSVDLTIADGQTMTLALNASGILALSGATS